MTFTKLYDTAAAAVAGVPDGATILIGGASRSNEPAALLAALHSHSAAGLTIVCDFSGWDGSDSIVKLATAGRIARIISPSPYGGAPGDKLREAWDSASVAIETVPQGTLAERLRAAGAGIGGVFVPVGLSTRFAYGRETRTINGAECILEPPLRADFALVRAAHADTLGNLAYQGPQRGWNAVMATAARVTIAQADTVGEPGAIDPELVVTPGIYVNRVVSSQS